MAAISIIILYWEKMEMHMVLERSKFQLKHEDSYKVWISWNVLKKILTTKELESLVKVVNPKLDAIVLDSQHSGVFSFTFQNLHILSLYFHAQL